MATGQETPGTVTTAEPKQEVVRIGAPTVLRGVTYGDYVRLRDEPDNGHLRMTYYDGTLEIMSPEFIHEFDSRSFGVFFTVLCEELDIPFRPAGATTFRRGVPTRRKGKGKEPDESFYFANVARVLGKRSLDVEAGDPPPDLWIEVDNRSSSRGREPVYAALGVPEIWRFRVMNRRLRFLRLDTNTATYEPIERSLSLPMLTPTLVLEALAMGENLPANTWSRRLRAWVRQKFVTPGGPVA
jgi:Uma2 family endonuclease